MALFETPPEALQWLCESKTEAADVYFKAIAAVMSNLGSHLHDFVAERNRRSNNDDIDAVTKLL